MTVSQWLKHGTRVAAIGAAITLLWACSPATAQDSVGACSPGTSGLGCNDAQDAFDAVTEQAYVIDMGQYPTSWGNWYGYAPLAKSSKNVDPIFFNNLISAQATSMCMETDQTPTSAEYAYWQGQGFGVDNSQSMVTPPAGDLYRFGAGYADFGGESNNIVSAAVEMSLANYNRLYVTRFESATNRPDAATGSNASVGFGGMASDGDPSFRADPNAVTGPAPVLGNNWVYVDNQLRTAGVVNDVNAGGGSNTAGDAAATFYPLNNSAVTHTTPTVIGCGDTSLTAGGNFNAEYVWDDGTHTGVLSTGAHIPGSSNTRGGVSFTHTYTALSSDGLPDAGSAAILGKANGPTDSFSIWGVNVDGSLDGTKLLTLPSTNGGIIDPVDGFNPYNYFTAIQNGEFDHYRSQVAFRGGNSQIAIAGDANDPNVLYAAGVVYYSDAGATDPYNYIAVVKYDKSTDSATWSIAGYTTSDRAGLPGCSGDCNDPGKAVLDGPGGNVIGRLIPLFTVTGCNDLGPSMSAPMLDTEGNVYFISEWERFIDTDDNGSCDTTDPDSGLFKAHRLPNGGYELEMLISLGNTIYGPNSDTRYQFRFMGVADGDSVSSGTAWSSNIVQDRLPGTLVNELDTFDMGGLVINVSTVYDVDKDGDYERPSGLNPDDPDSPDEAYEQLIYVRGYVRTGACCLGGGECVDTDLAFCNTNGGDFLGYGTVLRVLGLRRSRTAGLSRLGVVRLSRRDH